MKFLDQVLSLVRTLGSLEDLGRGLARILDPNDIRGFVFYGAEERCLLTIPYRPPETTDRLRDRFEQSDWRGRPREAFLSMFAELEISTGEIGEEVSWSFLGPEEKPLGAFASVRDSSAPPPTEAEEKTTKFFYRLVGEIARLKPRGKSARVNSRERDYLLDAMNQIGQLILEKRDLNALLPSLLKIALDVSCSEVGSIVLLYEGQFTSEVEWGLPGELLRAIRLLPEDQGIIQRVSETLEPLIIDDFSGPTVQVPRNFSRRVTSLVTLPLLSNGGLIGVLNVASGEDGRELLFSTVVSLVTISVLIATAVESSRVGEALNVSARGLLEEQNLLMRLLASLSEAVLVSDSSGCIVIANPAAEEMLGLGGGSGGGGTRERNAVTLRPFFTWLRNRWSKNTTREDLEHTLEAKSPTIFAVTINPLEGFANRATHVTVIRDVTEERTEAAVRLDGALKVAAEMETPLAAARVAFTLLRQQLGTSTRSQERILCRGLEKLSDLAEDLRDHAMLGEGSLIPRKEECCIGELITDALASFRDELKEKDIAFQGPRTVPKQPILADPACLGRVLARVFRVMVSFCDEGGWLRIDLNSSSGRCKFVLSFSLRHSCQEFSSLMRSHGESAGVTSADRGMLGLSVATRLLELQGGSFSMELVDEEEGRLVLEIPLQDGDQGNQTVAKTEEEPLGVDLATT